MTRIKLSWKKQKATGPVYLEEAAQLLGITLESLRAKIYRMKNGAQDTMPKPSQEPDGHCRLFWERDEFTAFVKTKRQLDRIVKGGKP